MATITHSREAVIQTLYAKDMGNEKAIEQFDEILKDKKIKNKKAEFAKTLLDGVLKHLDKIDEIIKEHLVGWDFDRMHLIDKEILRVAIYEILYYNTPYKIAIDEAVKLSKNFSEDKAKSYINGILDRIAKKYKET